MRAFTENLVCGKCGSQDVELKHVKRYHEHNYIYPGSPRACPIECAGAGEHLHCICRCGYLWQMVCKDRN